MAGQQPRSMPPETRSSGSASPSDVATGAQSATTPGLTQPNLYHALAETIPALVLTTSADGEVQYCNLQLLEYCGTDISGLQGARWVDYIHADDVEAGRGEWERRIQTLKPFSSEYRIKRHDGAYRWHLTRTAPLRDGGGEIHAWVAVSIDVHDRREAEQRTLEVAEALRRASQAKDEFLGLVSHELRTPVTTIYGNAQVLRRLAGQLDSAAVSQAMQDIEEEALRLQQLIDNMLVLARIDEGAELDTEPVLLGRLVARVAADQRSRAPSREVEIVDEAGDVPVRGEPLYVEQTLRNLLSNAIKYSSRDAPVRIAINRSEDCVAVRVLDGGLGIAAEETDRVFDAFYRTKEATDVAPGAGIGLAVAKRLIEAQGGETWIISRSEGGTEAGFTLPLEEEA
jgi:PAS domain S-box-containing protein